MLESVLINAMGFFIAYKILGKMILTSNEMDAHAWKLFGVCMVASVLVDLFIPSPLSALVSIIVFSVVCWRFLRLTFREAMLFSLLWSAGNLLSFFVVRAFLPAS